MTEDTGTADALLALLSSQDEWIFNRAIVNALGLANKRGNHSLTAHWRDLEEYMGDDSKIVQIEHAGSLLPERRCYNKRGVIKAALRARTSNAKAFQEWAANALSDALEGGRLNI